MIVETEGILVPLEVKLSATPRPEMASSIKAFQSDMRGKAAGGYVVHPGDVSLPLKPGVQSLPFGDL